MKKKIIGKYNDNRIIFCVTIAMLILSVIWFGEFRNQLIMGDDLGIPSRYSQDMSILKLIFGYSGGNKYRPVLNFIHYFEYRIFGLNYQCYFWANILVHTIIASYIFSIIKSLTNNIKISIVGAVCFITSIYSYYNITQLIGMMEALCLLFLLLIVKYLILYFKSQKNVYLYISLLFSFLLVFTHERYIVLVGGYYIFLFFCNFLDKKQKIKNILISSIPFAFNYILKTFVFGALFFEGTGGQQIKVDYMQTLRFIKQSVLSILGINTGVNYLNGYIFSNYSRTDKLISISIFIIIVSTIFAYIFFNIIKEKDKQKRNKQIFISSISVVFAGVLVLSYCLTIRVEMRWVFAPYIIFVLYFMYVLSNLKIKEIIKNSVLIIFCLFNVVLNYNYKDHTGELFFNRAFTIADSVYDNTVKKYGETISSYKLYFIYQNELYWAIGGDKFKLINQYLDSNVKGQFINDINEIKNYDDNIKIFQLNAKLQIEEIDIDYIKQKFDVEKNYNSVINPDYFESKGVVTPDIEADSPSKKGVCVLNPNSFTVLSGFSYEIEVDIKKGQALVYEYTNPLKNGDGCDYSVEYVINEGSTVIDKNYVSSNDSMRISINNINQDLTGGKVVFKVSSHTSDDMCDWVSFINPKVIEKK